MRKFIHVDMDAFYVSVEMRDNPLLRNKPVAVGGKSEYRGVLSTCNYIARKFGVHSAMPTLTAKKLCPHLIVVPGRMHVYQKVSSQMRDIFLRYTDLIEPLSLDEAYLDVTESKMLAGSATLIAQDIRDAIQQELGLTASAGIAPLKFLAKIASDINKPDGQYLIKPDQVIPFIEALPLNKIPGVGKVTFAKLEKLGFYSGADIRNTEQSTLIKHFGKFGISLWRKCQGIDTNGVQTSRIRKSVAIERTFSKNIEQYNELAEYLDTELVATLRQRAEKHLKSRSIDKVGVKIKFEDFRQTTKEAKALSIDTKLLRDLLAQAWERRQGKAARLLGIFLAFKQNDEKSEQLSFNFGKPHNDQNKQSD